MEKGIKVLGYSTLAAIVYVSSGSLWTVFLALLIVCLFTSASEERRD